MMMHILIRTQKRLFEFAYDFTAIDRAQRLISRLVNCVGQAVNGTVCKHKIGDGAMGAVEGKISMEIIGVIE